MFKSHPRERLIFTKRKPKPRRNLSWLWVILSLLLSLMVLELITRIVMEVSGKKKESSQSQTETQIRKAYRLKFVTENGQPYQTIGVDGTLVAQRSVSLGYQLIPNQKNQYWQINEQGFRDTESISTVKPKDEIRIFLLGGSTAFGYGSFNNQETISEQLEARLNQRVQQQKDSPQMYRSNLVLEDETGKKQAEDEAGKKQAEDEAGKKQAATKPLKIKSGNYRVINAAVPGYASGNELAQLALDVLRYKPDLIVVLDGYVDLMLPSSQTAIEIPQLEKMLDDGPTYLRVYLKKSLQPLRDKIYLVRVIQDNLLSIKPSEQQVTWLLDEQLNNLAQYFPQDQSESQRRIARYFQHHKQMAGLTAGARIPLIIAVQPEITGRNPSRLTAVEGGVTTELGREYIQKAKQFYPQFVAASKELARVFPHNVKTIELYPLEDEYPAPSFIDAIHLSTEGNKMLAEQLYYAIASSPKMQVVPTITKPDTESELQPQSQPQIQSQPQTQPQLISNP
ncbi:lipolytic protein G-D-S-L family protein [Stanieria sp. NIES-3757]|nr:lipolytic protein G-D-S-L family protein [Stanieria sp. NIES-3757]